MHASLVRKRTAKVYSFVLAVLPILSTYYSGIPGFTVGDLALAVFTVVAFFTPSAFSKNKYSPAVGWLFFGVGLIVFFDLFALLAKPEHLTDVAIRTVRYCFYIFCFAFTSLKLCDVKQLRKDVVGVSMFAAVYLYIQYAAYHLLGRVLHGFLEFLPLYVPQYAERDYEALYSSMFRPTSCFLEPAHFARYAALGVILLLWHKDVKMRDVMYALFITVSVLMSTSSIGYVLLAVIWVVFLIGKLKGVKSNFVRVAGAICIILSPWLILMLLRLPFVQETIARSLAGTITDDNTALGARFSGYFYYFGLPLYQKIFGMGFGIIPGSEWLSSAAYWLYGSGAVVFFVFCIFLVTAFVRLKGEKRMVILLLAVLFFSDDAFYSYMCVIFYSLAMLREERI